MKKYDKLVRDKIPEIIRKNAGRAPLTHIATPAEYRLRLRDKLLEEVNEFLASGDVGEIADIQEVLDAILEDLEFPKTKLEAVKVKKAKERGRFQKRIILDSA
jgi:predicted house-cleaning noncanonical NTP pyrophosphatase (MazG superfamily)